MQPEQKGRAEAQTLAAHGLKATSSGQLAPSLAARSAPASTSSASITAETALAASAPSDPQPPQAAETGCANWLEAQLTARFLPATAGPKAGHVYQTWSEAGLPPLLSWWATCAK